MSEQFFWTTLRQREGEFLVADEDYDIWCLFRIIFIFIGQRVTPGFTCTYVYVTRIAELCCTICKVICVFKGRSFRALKKCCLNELICWWLDELNKKLLSYILDMRKLKRSILFLSGVAVSVLLSVTYSHVLRTLTPPFAMHARNTYTVRHTGKTKAFFLLIHFSSV